MTNAFCLRPWQILPVLGVCLIAASSTWAQPAQPAFKTRGPLSCAATACHGSVVPDARPGNIARNEYVFWIERDPHARAYETLSNAASLRMLDRLEIRRDGQIVDTAGYRNCLACHNPAQEPDQRGPNHDGQFGVDCESCHGPAEGWIDKHYGGVPRAALAQLGAVATKDLAVRAELCVRCHVGADDRQVNHDLIAAGHPALKFEFAAYLDMLPKHWKAAKERRDFTDFETKTWWAGQLASAAASLTVLAQQAQHAAAAEPQAALLWPDFAHRDCFACHHDLAVPTWRQTRVLATSSVGRPLGSLPWGNWYFSLLERTAAATQEPAAQRLATDLGTLRQQMQSHPVPDAASVAKSASAARDQLRVWQTQQTIVSDRTAVLPQPLRGLLARSTDEPATHAGEFVEHWDHAAQFYLAAVAWYQSRLDDAARRGASTAALQPLGAALQQLRQRLAFPPPFTSPQNFVGLLTPDDPTSRREAVRQDIATILELLSSPTESVP
jgi:hypothetical protein